ncbi:hypothetical protein FACUT_4194 [Fusarium acutatum]|uniref:Uncharacterized protein n=1 Tax=Fusarium acutatum TaxID=78861 RepID=A0A8H4NIR8_9HYPO|nr:hypothetical protein FACUT_4194 [Fusarium acutatum]
MDPLEAGRGTTSLDTVDVEQSVDFPDGASDDSLDSSQARDVPERDTSADPEPCVFNICCLCKFRFHEGQPIIAVDRNNSTLPLTWDDKYYPENEILNCPFSTAKLFGPNMYFAEDSLGVRSVIACSDDGVRGTEEPGLRWISIPCDHYSLPFYVRINFDGLKLRNLDVTQCERVHHYGQRTRWAMFPRDLSYLNAPADNIVETSHRAAVHAVDWNLPGVSGYIIGLQSSCIDSIVPYRPGKLPPALIYAYGNARSTFLYLPVDPDERISELWLRSGDFPYDDDALIRAESLIVVTSNGRSLVLGPDIRSRSPRSDRPLNYEALADLPSTTPTRTFYYKRGHNESWLGFEKMTT